MQFIEWCNANNGFLTALLSILTLFVSVIAVVVSIHTARLPYRRKLVTSVATCIMPTDDPLAPKLRGFSVSVTNVGNRNINILHFGLAIKDGVQFVPFICNDFLNKFLSELDIDETILLKLFLTVIGMLSLKKFL